MTDAKGFRFPCKSTPPLKLPKPPGAASEAFLSTIAQGRWAEEKVMEALSIDGEFIGIRYGQSRYNHDLILNRTNWKKYIKKVYDQMAKYGKRPDVLVFRRSDADVIEIPPNGDISEELEEKIYHIVFKSIVGVECRSSAYYYDKYIKVRKKEGKTLSITVKEEDIDRLIKWRKTYCDKPIIYLQLFFDKGFFITFDEVYKLIQLIKNGKKPKGIEYRKEKRTGKYTYFIPVSYAKPALIAEESPDVRAEKIESWDGRVYAIVSPVGGRYKLTDEFKNFLKELSQKIDQS